MIEPHHLKGSNAILKFGVENAEWAALEPATSENLCAFRIITAEFHGFTLLEDPEFYLKAAGSFAKISATHTSVHAHPNNCCGIGLVRGIPLPALMKITFLRKDRATFWPYTGPLPLPIDYPNVPENDESVLNPWA